jgi:hypothetical protein
MSEREKELEALVVKYELAFQAMEEAYYQAVSGDNCGWWGNKYVSEQEQAQAMANDAVTQAREEVAKLGLELPKETEFEYEQILRPTYVDPKNKPTVRVEEVVPITNAPLLCDEDEDYYDSHIA